MANPPLACPGSGRHSHGYSLRCCPSLPRPYCRGSPLQVRAYCRSSSVCWVTSCCRRPLARVAARRPAPWTCLPWLCLEELRTIEGAVFHLAHVQSTRKNILSTEEAFCLVCQAPIKTANQIFLEGTFAQRFWAVVGYRFPGDTDICLLH